MRRSPSYYLADCVFGSCLKAGWGEGGSDRHCSVQWLLIVQVLHGSLEYLIVCCLFYKVWQLIPRFHYSLIAKEYFLMSVRAYCTARPCAFAACLVLAPSLFALNSNMSSAWPSFINLCTIAISCFSRLSSVFRPNSAHI
jgi:hypothetical protein